MERPQSDNLIDKHESVPTSEEAGLENQPRVAFASNLTLTRDQEDALIEHAVSRMEELEQDLGRDVCGSADWYKNGSGTDENNGLKTFMGKREAYERIYHNDVDWRQHLIGQIFEKSNFVAPIARRIARQMSARANNYFFGSSPWFAAAPVGYGIRNRELAEKVDRYLNYKLRQSKSVHDKRTAVELAFVRGETVIKTTHVRRDDIYETVASVLVDVEMNPIMDSSGGYIYEHDRWMPEMLVDENNPEAEPEPTGFEVLERDSATRRPSPEEAMFIQMKVTDRVIQFEGSESKPVYYKDFLCPLDAASIDKADCVVHLYDMSWMQLADTYRRAGALDSNEDPNQTVKAVEMLRELLSNDGRKKSLDAQREGDGDMDRDSTRAMMDDPSLNCAEFFLTYDANQDGIMENIMLVLDTATKLPIFYEYQANVTEDGLRPYTVIRPTEVDGRWYGIGAMEMFEELQGIIDLLVNRWNLSHSESGRVTFWNPDATYEGERTPGLKLNEGRTYTLKPGFTAEQALQVVPMHNIEHRHIREMFEFFIQMAMNESGISHANDANMAGLDQAKLATGIRNIEKSGQEMFAIYLSALEEGIEATVDKETKAILSNMKEKETFDFFDGEDTLVLEMSPDEVRGLAVNITILLTRFKNEEDMQKSWAAIEAVSRYYQQPFMVQEQTTTFYRKIIKSLDLKVDPAGTIVPVNVPPEAQPGAKPKQPSGMDPQSNFGNNDQPPQPSLS